MNATPCPHCRALTVVEPHAKLRFLCAACGGPRVPADVDGLSRSGAEAPALVAARRQQGMAFGLRAGGIMLALTAVLACGLGVILWFAAHVPAMVVGGVGALALLLALIVFGKARRADAAAMREIERAWQEVAREIVAGAKREVGAGELARWMRTDAAHAEAMLTALSATDRVRIDVGDDAEVRARIASEEPFDDRLAEAVRAAKERTK